MRFNGCLIGVILFFALSQGRAAGPYTAMHWQVPEFGTLILELVEVNGRPLSLYSSDGKSLRREGLEFTGSSIAFRGKSYLQRIRSSNPSVRVCLPALPQRVCGTDVVAPASLPEKFDYLVPDEKMTEVDSTLVGLFEGSVTPDEAQKRLEASAWPDSKKWIPMVFPGTRAFRRRLDSVDVHLDYATLWGLWHRELDLKYDVVVISPLFRPPKLGFSMAQVKPSSQGEYENYCEQKKTSAFPEMRDSWCRAAKKNFVLANVKGKGL